MIMIIFFVLILCTNILFGRWPVMINIHNQCPFDYIISEYRRFSQTRVGPERTGSHAPGVRRLQSIPRRRAQRAHIIVYLLRAYMLWAKNVVVIIISTRRFDGFCFFFLFPSESPIEITISDVPSSNSCFLISQLFFIL